MTTLVTFASAASTDAKALLGAFIRAHRERLPAPADGGRRRTPGLRREELAAAANVSPTWVTWLEQGRDVAASAAALARLAAALRLTAAERASLFDLAGRRDPVAPAAPDGELPREWLALPSLMSVPAYLLDHTWTARAWNGAAEELFPDWLGARADSRNLLEFVFCAPAAPRLIADWPERARRLVAEFRADFTRRPTDPARQALIARLGAASALFAAHWQDQDVLHRDGGARRFHHPRHGERTYTQTTLLVAARQECKLVCLQPGHEGGGEGEGV